MISEIDPNNNESLKVDTVVIGSGPGGYVAAIRLGQLGKAVVLIEKGSIGGVCLNVGCIPSKALINASKLVKDIRNSSRMGIDAEVRIDLQRLQNWKQSVVNRLTSGVSSLLSMNKVQILHGEARFLSPNLLAVEDKSRSPGVKKVEFESAIIATGSSPIQLPNLKFDGNRIISSTEALALTEAPKRILIVGGGVIGLEIGMAYANMFGTELTIVELLDQLLPGVDPELVDFVSRSLQRLKATIHLKSRVKSADVIPNAVRVTFETPDAKEQTTEVDFVLVSAGRTPNTRELGLETIGVKSNPRGYVEVDKQMRTSVRNIFAIGDIVGEPFLAHKASRQGIVAAEVISGMKSSFDIMAMPSAIFTDPEIATVGLSSLESRRKNIDTVTGKFPFSASGRALASGDSDGLTKIIADKSSGLILGVGIVGKESSDLISEASIAIEMGATLEDIALTIHPHPTLPETLQEAAEHALGRAIHVRNAPASS